MKVIEALKRTSFVAATSIGALGCGETISVDTSRPSRVVDLRFEPAHDAEEPTGLCLLKSSGVCLLEDTETVHYDDAYSITLEQCEGGPRRTTEDEQCAQTTLSDISKEEYTSLRVGSVVLLQDERLVSIPQ